MSKEYVNVDGWHVVVDRIEKSKVEGNFKRNTIFAQRKRESASNKMVAFHLAWQPDYARFGIACPLSVLNNGGLQRCGEEHNVPAKSGGSLLPSRFSLCRPLLFLIGVES